MVIIRQKGQVIFEHRLSEREDQEIEATVREHRCCYDALDMLADLLTNLPALPERYEFRSVLGQGGMGLVLATHDSQLDRATALKIAAGGSRADDKVRRRFHHEAQITAQLQHPNIPAVHERGELADGRPYFAMVMVNGKTLAQLLDERRDCRDRLPHFLSIFVQICQTVAYAHARGVIHRDLKPHNVMVGAFGEVQVMDWGLAKVLMERASSVPSSREKRLAAPSATEVASASDALQTEDGSLLGTPAYMAPEQARGEVHRVDERSDVFGLGAVLCEILTGLPPYSGPLDRLQQAQQADLADAFVRLQKSRADKKLIQLARRCLAPKAEDRPANAGEVARAVVEHQEQLQRRLQRRKTVNALLAAALVFAVSVAGAAVWYFREQAERAQAKLEHDKAVQEAKALLAKSAQAHFNTGVGLLAKDDVDGAIAAFSQTIACDPQSAHAHSILGVALMTKGDVDRAINAQRQAIICDPAFGDAHNLLGVAFMIKGDVDGAIAAFNRAIKCEPEAAFSNANLGVALRGLGVALRARGSLQESVTALEKAACLLPKHHGIQLDLRKSQRWIAFMRLPDILAREYKPASRIEAIELAEFLKAPFQKQYAWSLRLYNEWLEEGALVEHRVDAACAALLLAAGKDVKAHVPIQEVPALRMQAHQWLLAALKMAHQEAHHDREGARQQLVYWIWHPSLASVRDPAQLPEDEQERWGKFWAEVDQLLATLSRPKPWMSDAFPDR